MRQAHVDNYLARIGYRGPLRPDLATLAGLQLAHMRAVPFENLSIHHGQAIVLELDALYRKVVEGRRGGFCYELNGLFASLLGTLGFEVTMHSAGVAGADGSFGPVFDHMTLAVQLDQRYLVDAGFGDSCQEPVRIGEREPQLQADWACQVVPDADAFILMREGGQPAGMRAQYRFSLDPRALGDFTAMCEHYQYAPESHFRKKRLCTRATPDGRITLSGMRLIVTTAGAREESVLASEQEFARVLEERFSIVL